MQNALMLIPVSEQLGLKSDPFREQNIELPLLLAR